MITDETGTEIRPTEKRVLHVTIALVDYQALLDENKRMKELVNAVLQWDVDRLSIKAGWKDGNLTTVTNQLSIAIGKYKDAAKLPSRSLASKP